MENKPIHILLIEDNPGDAKIIQATLRSVVEMEFLFTVAGRLSAGLELLKEHQQDDNPVDVVLLDLNLPDCVGFESFEKVHEFAPKVPIILMTGLVEDDLSSQARTGDRANRPRSGTE